jgi:hypothetical protein
MGMIRFAKPAASRNVPDHGQATRLPRGVTVPAQARPGPWWGALAAAVAVLLLPLLITDVPPILDYPNHLARLVLLHAGPDDPVLGRFFEPHWTILPNLAIDVIVTPLLGLLPPHVAGRSMLGGILLLNLAGVIALHRALFGRRSYWPLASVLMAYNSTFLLGFLNWIGRRRLDDLAGAAADPDDRRGQPGVDPAVLLPPDGRGVLPGADRQRRTARDVGQQGDRGPDRRPRAGGGRAPCDGAADEPAGRRALHPLDEPVR